MAGVRSRIIRDFAEHTSLHGLFGVKHARCFGKLLWMSIITVMWYYCGVQIYKEVRNYFRFPTRVAMSLHHSSNVTFPAVTLCNLNPVRWSFVSASPQFSTIRRSLLRRLKQAGWNTARQRTFTDAAQLNLDVRHALYTHQVNLTAGGHHLSKMLLECSYQGLHCQADNFSYWQHGHYGNCFTIRVQATELPCFVGPRYGLSLTLNTEDAEYLPRVSSATGFRVQVHPRNLLPFPEDHGFNAAPGAALAVAVSNTKLHRLPLPYDGVDCAQTAEECVSKDVMHFWRSTRYSDFRYGRDLCVKPCYQRMLLRHCGCVDTALLTYDQAMLLFHLPSPPPACDFRNATQLECFRAAAGKFVDDSFCNRQCPLPCREESYLTEVSSSLWPRRNYLEAMSSATVGWRLTTEQARDNLVRLDVYFSDINVQLIEETAAYQLWQVLSNIGGTLGLYAGLSFLTLAEVVELCLRLIWPTNYRPQTEKRSLLQSAECVRINVTDSDTANGTATKPEQDDRGFWT